jgi:F-type H+-transporting ATPase subunit b
MAEVHTTAITEVPHEAEHVEPTAFGFGPGGWVALAMLLVFAIFIWKKVPGAIGKSLDSKIDAIRGQLAEAEALRKEAEALKAEYQKKSKAADKESAAMIERARHEADSILAKAKVDAEALVERRGRLAEEKIAAEERAAINEIRSAAASAAARAAERLIADRHDSATDSKLVDQAIGALGKSS